MKNYNLTLLNNLSFKNKYIFLIWFRRRVGDEPAKDDEEEKENRVGKEGEEEDEEEENGFFADRKIVERDEKVCSNFAVP